MDTTKEYVEMCRTAIEIQTTWDPSIYDYHLWNNTITMISTESFKAHTGFEIRDRFSWGDENKYGEYIAGYFKDHVIMEFPVMEPFDDSITEQFQMIYTEYSGAFWLPRQDQLQDMLDDTFSNREIVPLTSKLHDVCIHLIKKYNFNGRTMEQLWLAFVMYEKYGKSWNGEGWA